MKSRQQLAAFLMHNVQSVAEPDKVKKSRLRQTLGKLSDYFSYP